MTEPTFIRGNDTIDRLAAEQLVAELTPDEITVAQALVAHKLGFLAPQANDEFLAECRDLARIAVAALDLPAREAAIRADERAKVDAKVIEFASAYAPAARRTPPRQGQPVTDLRLRAIAAAGRVWRSDPHGHAAEGLLVAAVDAVLAEVRADLLAIAREHRAEASTHRAGSSREYAAALALIIAADRIAPSPVETESPCD